MFGLFIMNVPITYEVFPLYKNGPHFYTTFAEPLVPNKWGEVLKRCVDALTKPKRSTLEDDTQNVLDLLRDEMHKEGMAIHLLPLHPFGVLSNIVSKKTAVPLSPNQAVDYILKQVRQSCQGEAVWINVFTDRTTDSVLAREAEQQNLDRLPDPLQQGHGDDLWQRFLLLNHSDRPFQTDNVLGQYVINKSTQERIVSTFFASLRDFTPHFVTGESKPVEITIILRLMHACQVFQYDYTIERIKSPGIILHGSPNRLYEPGGRTHGFIRVPRDFVAMIDNFLEQRQGVASLSRLVRHIQDEMQISPNDALWLIRHVSFRDTDDLLVSNEHHWVFAYNRTRDGSTLAADKLDFNTTNMGTSLRRSLSMCEKGCGMFHSDKDAYKDFLKKTIIALPYQCDLRDRDNVQYMCQKRSMTKKDIMKHVREHHAITQAEERMLDHLQTSNVILKGIQLESQEEWLEKRGLLGILDHKRLTQIPNLGNLLKEFMTMHCTLLEAISQTDQAYDSLKETMEGVKNAKRQLLADSASSSDREVIQKEITAIDNCLLTFEKFLGIQQSMMLSERDLVEYMTSWSKAVSTQQMILSKCNRMRESIQEARSRGARLGTLLTKDWSRELDSAGTNFATISPDACFQNLKEDSQQNEKGFGMLYLALAGQAARHDEKASKHVVDTYMETFSKEGFVPPASASTSAIKDHNSPEKQVDKIEVKDHNSPEKQVDKVKGTKCPGKQAEEGVCRKRHFEDRDSDTDNDPSPTYVPTYKALKYEEAVDDKPHTVKQFRSFLDNFQSGTFKGFDSRHLLPSEVARFFGGMKMLPGSEIAPVGKGSSRDVTALELIDPRTIHVDLSDFRDLVFYLLWKLQNSTPGNIYIYTEHMKVAFLNVLNIMYALSSEGNAITREALSKAIVTRANKKTTLGHIRRELWLLFLAAVSFLNRNNGGLLNGLFAVRFSKHGDASGVPVKMMPDRSYESQATLNISDYFQSFLQACNEDSLESFSGTLTRSDYGDLAKNQRDLVLSIQADFCTDRVQVLSGSRQPQLLAVQAGSNKDRKRSFKKAFPESESPKHKHKPKPSEYLQTFADLAERSTFRNYDTTPCHAMTKEEDYKGYDAEVNRFREMTCAICMEQFSTRPLEGLNCVYKQLEVEFRREKSLSENVVIEKNEKLFKEYLSLVSEKIEQKSTHGKCGVEANGMHLFHRECLLRYIQLEALNSQKDVIRCPICMTEVFSSVEKPRIVANIHETASRLALAAENELIPQYSIDSLVNMKRDLVQGEDFITRYFPQAVCNNDFSQEREDAIMLDDLCTKKLHHHQPETMGATEKYVDMVVKKKAMGFTPKEAVNMVPAPVCVC